MVCPLLFYYSGTHDLGMAMDIGIESYITQNQAIDDGSVAGLTALIQTTAAGYGAGWSDEKAIALADLLRRVPSGSTANNNNQAAAVRDLLSLFAVSQQAGGSRDAVRTHIASGSSLQQKETIVKALFGDADNGPGLAWKLHVGAPGKNTYPYMREVLTQLANISATNIAAHQNHFHLYVRPPAAEPIGRALLGDAIPSPSKSATQVAATISVKKSAQYNYVLSACDRPYFPHSIIDENKDAYGHISPAASIENFLRIKLKQPELQLPVDTKLVVSQGFKYGDMVPVEKYGPHAFRYVPHSLDDFLKKHDGIDDAVIEVETLGKRIKLLYKVMGGTFVTEDPTEDREFDRKCQPRVRRIGLIDRVRSDDFLLEAQQEGMRSWLRSAYINGTMGNFGNVTFEFASLSGAVAAQTTGSGNDGKTGTDHG